MPTGSGDFADVKLCFPGITDQNWALFAIGVMAEVAHTTTARVPELNPAERDSGACSGAFPRVLTKGARRYRQLVGRRDTDVALR
jgi:hypothetical protein